MKGEQQAVPVPAQNEPNPAEHECNWCDRTAANLHEIKHGRKRLGSRMYIFTCNHHKYLGENATAPKPRDSGS